MQNVRGEGGAIKYSDFRDLVINLRIERKWWQNGNLDDGDDEADDDNTDIGYIDDLYIVEEYFVCSFDKNLTVGYTTFTTPTLNQHHPLYYNALFTTPDIYHPRHSPSLTFTISFSKMWHSPSLYI